MRLAGQIPWIELNGRQIPDSNFIIDHLIGAYNLDIDTSLDDLQRAEARAFTKLIEESLFRTIAYDRSRDFKWLADDEKGFGYAMSGFKRKIFQTLMVKQVEKRIRGICEAQGIGRHSPAEVEQIAKSDLLALSIFLGDKRYFFGGDKPTTLDATAFGHIAQLLYAPLNAMSALPAYIEETTPNLAHFVRRLRDEYWQDWNELTKKRVMNVDDVHEVKV